MKNIILFFLILQINAAFSAEIDAYRAYHFSTDGFDINSKHFDYLTNVRLKKGDELTSKIRVEKLAKINLNRDDLEYVIAIGFPILQNAINVKNCEALMSFDDGVSWQKPIFIDDKYHSNFAVTKGVNANAIVFKQYALSNAAKTAILKFIAGEDDIKLGDMSTGTGFHLTKTNQFLMIESSNYLTDFGIHRL